MLDLKKEIVINYNYAHLFESENTNDEGKSKPVIKKRSLFTSDFVKKIIPKKSCTVLPPNCRYFEKFDSDYIVVIEEPPAIRTISLQIGMDKYFYTLKKQGKLELYEYPKNYLNKIKYPVKLSLAFPYVIFIFHIQKSASDTYSSPVGKVFVRSSQIIGPLDELFKMPLPNISDQQYVCFGEHGYNKKQSISAMVQHMIMVFWSAVFNTDYLFNIETYRDTPILNNFLEWQAVSHQDPMFVYRANWIPMNGTLQKVIDSVKQNCRLTQATNKNSFLFDAFYHPHADIKQPKIQYDMTSTLYLPSEQVSVGDTIKFKNNIVFIDSFGSSGMGMLDYMLVDYKGKKIRIRLTKRFLKFLEKNIKETLYKTELKLKDGTIIKINDIVSMGETNEYYKVIKIRKSRGIDDEYEILLNSAYYLCKQIKLKKFDENSILLYGKPLNKKTEYLLSNSDACTLITEPSFYKFDLFTPIVGNRISARFRNILNDRVREVPTYKIENKVIPVDMLSKVTGYIRVGNQLRNLGKSNAYIVNGRLCAKNYYKVKVEDLIHNNMFFIKGLDFDISFKIGDNVVVANWKNPVDMLVVKTIIGFKVTESSVKFVLQDKHNNKTEVDYVKDNRISIGKIRKAAIEINGLKVGTKIKAKESYIPCFPKKDTNIIVAFLIDSQREPLVLCSNACTLWYSDVLNKFEHIPFGSDRWNKTTHTEIDLTKIRMQAGDIVQFYEDDKINVVHYTDYSMQLYISSFEDNTFVSLLQIIDSYLKQQLTFSTIISPRFSSSKVSNNKKKAGYPDFHGEINKLNNFQLYFPDIKE